MEGGVFCSGVVYGVGNGGAVAWLGGADGLQTLYDDAVSVQDLELASRRSNVILQVQVGVMTVTTAGVRRPFTVSWSLLDELFAFACVFYSSVNTVVRLRLWPSATLSELMRAAALRGVHAQPAHGDHHPTEPTCHQRPGQPCAQHTSTQMRHAVVKQPLGSFSDKQFKVSSFSFWAAVSPNHLPPGP